LAYLNSPSLVLDELGTHGQMLCWICY
jgi:hypothetical protein